MALNLNELLLDRVRSLTAHSIDDENYGALLFRLTSLEDPSLATSAEGEEVVDAIGALITTLYRAKKATFSASNSLISLDLAAAQYGATKEVLGANETLVDYTYEILDVKDGKATLTNEPIKIKVGDVETSSVMYIYAVENGQTSTKYVAGSAVSATEFKITGKEIEVPTGVTGKIYVEYSYEADGKENNGANRIANNTSNFPAACSMKIFAYFRDKCNENVVYSGVIVSSKAKLNPEQVELALTSTGKHAFEFQMMRDYCDDEAELFAIIVAE